MEIFVIAALVALPLTWGLVKLDNYLNGSEIVLILENEEEDDNKW